MTDLGQPKGQALGVDDAVGFIGLGAMGGHMARRLAEARVPLVVCDLDPAKCAPLEALGARVARSPAEVARDSRRILCMVETTDQVRAVVAGANGIVEGAADGHRVACLSTSAPAELARLAQALAPRGVGFIDAPVSGGTEGAAAGTLAIFASGDPAVIDAFDDVFRILARHVFRLGAVGQGTVAKLVNNMLLQINTVALAEALTVGTRAGLDPNALCEMLKVSTGNSAALALRGPRMLSRNFANGGTMDLTLKDQEQAMALARQLGVPGFLIPVTNQIYQVAKNMGYSKEDGSAVIKVYEALSRKD